MKTTVLTLSLISLVALTGCYDFENGSTADVLSSGTVDPNTLVSDATDKNRASVFWEICDPNADWFGSMKSGDECAMECAPTDIESGRCVGHGCGFTTDPVSEDTPSTRSVICIDDVLNVTNGFPVAHPAPRPDITWTDCSAVTDGRNDEACSGSFNCYTPTADGCIEVVTCSSDTASTTGSSLLRYKMCDDALNVTPLATEDAVTDCQSSLSARPLDACTGTFMCAGNLWKDQTLRLASLHACDATAGFCNASDDTVTPPHIVWCDGERLHIFWNMDYEMSGNEGLITP